VLDEKVLLAQVLLNKLDVTFITASDAQVIHSSLIDGEITHSCTVFRSHVSNSGSISKGKILHTRSEELNELANDTTLSEHLDASKDQVSGSCSLWEITVEVETNDLGKHHGDGLAKHDSLSLNTTNTPASNAETVDHSSVRISADNRVWVEHVVTVEDNTGEVLEVDLMDNTRAGRHNLEVVEGF